MGIFKNIINGVLKDRKKAVIALILVIIIGVFIYRTVKGTSRALQYQTATAAKQTLVESVTESGQVAVANRVAVTTGASGTVNNVYVKSGDSVTAGETVADVTLDIAGQQRQAQAWASYLSAQNSLNSAQANLNTLQSTMFKANQSFVNDRGVFNPSTDAKNDPVYIEENSTWLAAEAAYKNQSNVIAQDQVSLSNAYLSYQAVSSKIVSPTDGIITDLTITQGMQVGGSNSSIGGTSGTNLTTVANITSKGLPTVTVSLSEADVAKVKTGDKATLTFDALPNQTFTGKVLGINTTGTVASGVTSYPATIVLDLPNERIFPNMSVTANIITQVKDNVLSVPIAAVQTSNGQSTVRVLQNGNITTVPVEVGISSDSDTEIVSGLNGGETVIVGFVPRTTTGTTSSSPFSSSNPFRGLGGGGGGGFRARTGGN